MAEDELEDGEISEEEISQPEKGLKKKILLYLIPAIVLIGIGVGFIAVFFTKVGNDKPLPYDVVTQKNPDGSGESTTVFYTLPEFSADLRTSNDVIETIRLKLNLELPSVETIAVIDGLMPRLNDIIIAHLTELTPEEVSGSEGFYALKTELLYRINLMIAPVKILNLNIKDLNIVITEMPDKQED